MDHGGEQIGGPSANGSSPERLQGWCPLCGLRSVVRTIDRLVCSNMHCNWESERTVGLEDKVLARPPAVSEGVKEHLRSMFSVGPRRY